MGSKVTHPNHSQQLDILEGHWGSLLESLELLQEACREHAGDGYFLSFSAVVCKVGKFVAF